MPQRAIAGRGVIISVLSLQFIPLVLFPPESFSPNSQEWWLPVLLVVMVLVADVELIIRHSLYVWPWHLIAFAQGFNIISRIMMLWPHATRTVGGTSMLNLPYIVLTVMAMVMSALLLWYAELPEVRMGLGDG